MPTRYDCWHHWLVGVLMAAFTASLCAQQDTGGDGGTIAAPRERSTLESIQFAPVEEEQLGETSIQGALGPPSAGLVGPGTEVLVEPVHLSDELQRALKLERSQLERQRDQLFGPELNRPPGPAQVQYPGFRNRSYDPGSTTHTQVRE